MPSPRTHGLSDLRLQDASTFLDVCRTKSVTSAARELGVTPSQVSKAIGRLESALGRRLFSRGARGIALSSSGRQVFPQLERMVLAYRALGHVEQPLEGELILAAPSSLLPPILPAVIEALPGSRLRGIELVPALMRGYVTDELFDIALMTGATEGLPPSWASVRVGELRKSLLASPAVAAKLGLRPRVEDLRAALFVGPVAYDGGKFVPTSDDCPMSLAERTIGSEVGSMGAALRVAAQCGHLVFGPLIAAQRELKEGSLVELQVRGWNVSETLYLACDAERVLSRVQAKVLEAVRSVLGEAQDHRGARS